MTLYLVTYPLLLPGSFLVWDVASSLSIEQCNVQLCSSNVAPTSFWDRQVLIQASKCENLKQCLFSSTFLWYSGSAVIQMLSQCSSAVLTCGVDYHAVQEGCQFWKHGWQAGVWPLTNESYRTFPWCCVCILWSYFVSENWRFQVDSAVQLEENALFIL